jgi:hypothetical protein
MPVVMMVVEKNQSLKENHILEQVKGYSSEKSAHPDPTLLLPDPNHRVS